MNKFLFISLIFFILPISFSLTSISNQTLDNCITCNPILKFQIYSSKDISINSASINMNESINYVSFYPKKIFSEQKGIFEFDLDKVPCDFLDKVIQVNLTINYTNSSGNYIYHLNNFKFKIKNPISVNIEKDYESVKVGNDIQDLLYINNTCQERNLSISIKSPESVYIVFYTPNGVYDNLSSIKLIKSYPIKLDLIGSYLGNGEILINVTDPSCSNVTWSGKIEVQTYTISKGITSFKSMSEFSPLISIIILSSIVFGKIIKKGMMK